jgi:hypothetical protein
MSLILNPLHSVTMGHMALGLTQPLTEKSTMNFPRGKGQPVHKADSLTNIYELTV